MKTHTPGPWRTMHSHKVGFLNVFTTHDTGELEATDFICEIGPGVEPGSEAEANARLIAAAPELLEALEAAIESVDAMPTNTTVECQRHLAATKNWYDSARRAISKAKGSS